MRSFWVWKVRFLELGEQRFGEVVERAHQPRGRNDDFRFLEITRDDPLPHRASKHPRHADVEP